VWLAGERQLRGEFMEAGRREMGYGGEPLKRRVSADQPAGSACESYRRAVPGS
jgi:hypothetical protein